MDVKGLMEQIGRVMIMLGEERAKAKTPDDSKLIDLGLIGLTLFGELLIDIKRIADAAELQANSQEPIDPSKFKVG